MSAKSGPDAPRRPPWSLAARLTAWYTASAFLMIALVTAFWYWVLAGNLDREDDGLLADKVSGLRKLLQDGGGDAAALRREFALEQASGQHVRFLMRLVNAQGETVVETPGMNRELPPALFAAHQGPGDPGTGTEIHSRTGRSYRIWTAWADLSTGQNTGALLQVALDRSLEEDLLAGYRGWLVLVLGGGLGCSLLAGYWLARRGLSPVARMTSTARHIRSVTLNQRLALTGLPAELLHLAGTFNEMLDRLEESFTRLSRFSADIAHELRTPLNNIRGEVEVCLSRERSVDEYREALGSALDECVRLSRLIDSLLFLARAESPETQIAREPVDINRELASLCEFYSATAAEAGVSLCASCPAGLCASVDRTLFQRALANLISNSLAHTTAGGLVTLSAAADAEVLRVEVADSGGGITAEHLPHVFDRFYRVDAARSTDQGRIGLGLAIVKSITALHGGSATITSDVKRGTKVTLSFANSVAADFQSAEL